HHHPHTTTYYTHLLHWTGRRQHVRVSDNRVTARLHEGDGGRYLWLLNPSRLPLQVSATLSTRWKPFADIDVRWGDKDSVTLVDGRSLDADIPARDAIVVRLL
ncbi:hypothetical protein, partial [Actinopolymorpha pittospori]